MFETDVADNLLVVLNKPEMAGCWSPSPTLDHYFLVEKPIDMVNGNNNISSEARRFFRSLDILTGVNNGEGALCVLFTLLRLLGQPSMDNTTVTVTDIRHLVVPHIIGAVIKPPNNKSRAALTNALAFEYAKWDNTNDNKFLRKSLMKLLSDTNCFIPAALTVDSHASILAPVGRSYVYEFTVEPPVRSISTPIWFQGVNHGDELLYAFGSPFLNTTTFDIIPTSRGATVRRDDKILALGMMTAWSNFSKSG